MNVFELSAESSPSLQLVMPVGDELDKFRYLDPHHLLSHADQDARVNAARRWIGMTANARKIPGVRESAYIQDAVGGGFFLPGCVTCISDRGRQLLEPHLRGQASFLSIDIVGAPTRYWVLYALRYYDSIDLQKSGVSEPPQYTSDRRLELRQPCFVSAPELEDLMLFRVAGSKDYVPYALGDFVTQRFVDLAIQCEIGGFAFVPCCVDGSAPPANIMISEGPKFDRLGDRR